MCLVGTMTQSGSVGAGGVPPIATNVGLGG
jgi:hypothetical protein